MISPQLSITPTGQNQPLVDPKVDPLPYSSVVSSSPSSSLLGESIGTSNQVAMKKKKQIHQRGNQAIIDLNETYNDKPSIKPHKVRYSCKLCT